jgi:glycosyltransferase involved in cell wall biosynthesis
MKIRALKVRNRVKEKCVLMLLSNPATYDMRPLKEASHLVKNGYKVVILAWNREGKYPRQNLSNGLLIRRFNFKSPYGQNIRTVISFFLYYVWCIFSSFTLNFKAIHCHDVDTFFCGILMKMLKLGRIKLIYDMHDHPICFLEKFPKAYFLVKVVFAVAKHYADHIIVVNDGFLEYLTKMGFQREKMTVIMNVPSKSEYSNFNVANRNRGKFTIFYYGDIGVPRGVHKLIEAVKDLKCVELLLAGKGDLVPIVKNLEKKYNNIKYLGWISTSDIDHLVKKADLIPSLYMPDNINHILASPGKLFTAMVHGVPVLVPEGSYQARIVKKFGCGIVVDMNDTAKVREVISKLASSPNLCRKPGENGIKAVNELFNWQIMEKRLIMTYNSLVS